MKEMERNSVMGVFLMPWLMVSALARAVDRPTATPTPPPATTSEMSTTGMAVQTQHLLLQLSLQRTLLLSAQANTTALQAGISDLRF